MIFEIPKSEDLNSELSLEKTGCVITVRNCKHFNDDSARKLFPRSSAEYVSAETYTLPESYFSQSFWDSERERHQRVLNTWISNKNKLATIAPSEKTEDFKYVNCMACLVALINMYEWVLDMCWDGNRSKPPMPVQLYKARLSELKDVNSLGFNVCIISFVMKIT
ncbi:hypothetical protein KIN20_004361 [Parelaphostrongylus tenuis]|uniref:Uncharacterized protein n=1 Tax=Parelaphostrongylus tenuis TaxID=148309 RepID=A0AAD5M1L1_PARTN|nr:hypothetical protein KIN20_004361 [Parelaphostrongylus tenuis]